MCPTHCNRRVRIHFTRSNDLHFNDTCCCCVLPLITLIMFALYSFRWLFLPTPFSSSRPLTHRLVCCICLSCIAVATSYNAVSCHTRCVSVAQIVSLPLQFFFSRLSFHLPLPHISNQGIWSVSSLLHPLYPMLLSADSFASPSFSLDFHSPFLLLSPCHYYFSYVWILFCVFLDVVAF